MRKTKQATASTRQIHVTEKTYKTLRHAAVDQDVRLLDMTEEVIAAGLNVVKTMLPDPQSPAN